MQLFYKMYTFSQTATYDHKTIEKYYYRKSDDIKTWKYIMN